MFNLDDDEIYNKVFDKVIPSLVDCSCDDKLAKTIITACTIIVIKTCFNINIVPPVSSDEIQDTLCCLLINNERQAEECFAKLFNKRSFWNVQLKEEYFSDIVKHEWITQIKS